MFFGGTGDRNTKSKRNQVCDHTDDHIALLLVLSGQINEVPHKGNGKEL